MNTPEQDYDHEWEEMQPHETCPKCGSTMVARVAKKGNRAGQNAGGAPKFPACRSTLSID